MIYDLLDYFKNGELSKKKVLDNYKLKEGLYVKVGKRGIENSLVVTKNTEPEETYEWYRERDYLSAVSTTNKCLDAPQKVMHNNNYLTLFFKWKSIFDVNRKAKRLAFDDNMAFFYEKMGSKFLSPEFVAFADAMDILGVDIDRMEKSKTIITDNIAEIVKIGAAYGLEDDVYVRIFIDEETGEYRRESLRYTLPYIFNSNAHNIKTADGTYGLSALNMGMNSKKPFFAHKTTKFKVPFRISLEDALAGKLLYDWLGQQRRGYLDVSNSDAFELILEQAIGKNQNVHYLFIDHGIENVIRDYDFLPGVTDDIETFRPEDYLLTGFYEAKRTKSRRALEKWVDQYLFRNKLARNYKTGAKEIKISATLSTELYKMLMLYRKAFEDYFVRCDDRAIKHCIEKATMALVLEKIDREETRFFTKTGNALNLRFALLNFFHIEGGIDMGSKVIVLWEELNQKKMSSDLVVCESDDEFYFTAGQFARYAVSQSEAKEINYSMVDSCIKAKSPQKLKEELRKMMEKYSHAFSMKDVRVNNIVNMVMGYEPDGDKINLDMFLAGLASKNIFYVKKEEQ